MGLRRMENYLNLRVRKERMDLLVLVTSSWLRHRQGSSAFETPRCFARRSRMHSCFLCMGVEPHFNQLLAFCTILFLPKPFGSDTSSAILTTNSLFCRGTFRGVSERRPVLCLHESDFNTLHVLSYLSIRGLVMYTLHI